MLLKVPATMVPLPRLKPHQGFALFSYGFRPFFFFGACDAALAIAVWLPLFEGETALPTLLGPRDWHVHEMLFGYVPAIAVRQGLRALRTEMPIIVAMTDKLSPRMIHMIETLCTDWRHLDRRIETVSDEIKTLSEQDNGAKRLMTVPGVDPIISTATVAAIGSGEAFSKGRDFGAWLGLVPRQMSTGGRTILGTISKRGNRYLRMLFVQAARAVLLRPQSWERHGLKSWIEAAGPAAQSLQASDCARQQNRPHRMGRSPWRSQL
jgi:transposase